MQTGFNRTAIPWQNTGSCVLCAPLDWHIGRHINRQSTDVSDNISADRHISWVSIDMSTEMCCAIYQPTYRSSIGRYVTDTRPICQLTINRAVSLDISTDILIKHWSICRLTLDRYVGRYVDREWLSDCRPTCRSIGYRASLHFTSLHFTISVRLYGYQVSCHTSLPPENKLILSWSFCHVVWSFSKLSGMSFVFVILNKGRFAA